MIEVVVEAALTGYSEVYQKMYRVAPKGLRVVGADQIQVNGTTISLLELERRTDQLQQEYAATLNKRRQVVTRLVRALQSA